MEEKEEQDLGSLFGLARVFLLSPPPLHRQVVLRRVVVRAARQTSKQQVLIHMTRLEGEALPSTYIKLLFQLYYTGARAGSGGGEKGGGAIVVVMHAWRTAFWAWVECHLHFGRAVVLWR